MSDEKSQIINPYKRKLRSSGAVVHNNEKGSSSQHLPHDAKQNEVIFEMI